MNHLLHTLALSAFCAVAVMAEEGEWPQFHGPGRDNRSAETGLPRQWPAEGPKLLWTARGLGHGFSSVAVVEGILYTAGSVGETTAVTAVDAAGRTLWQVPVGRAWEGSVPGSRATPTIDGRRLYHQTPHGEIVCLDRRTGTELWRLNALERFGAENINWAISESLLVDGPRVLCCPGGPVAMAALDKHTGATLWQSASAGDLAGYSSPALGTFGRLRIALVLTSAALIGVDADRGTLLFRHEHRTPFDENIFLPLVHDGRVFISTRTTGSELLRVTVEGNEASAETVWATEELDNQHGGAVLVDGHLYGACHVRNGGAWVCLEWSTGRKCWQDRGVGKGCLTYADGMLYTLSERGTLGLVRATPQRFELVSQFDLPPEGEGPFWAHPVVAGGRLYVRHGEFLYAYELVRGEDP